MILRWSRLLLLTACCAFLASAVAFGQGRGPGGPGGMGGGIPHNSSMGPGGMGGMNGDHSSGPPAPGSGSGGANSTMRGGLQLGPPGRWWDNKGFAKTLGLRKDQQQRMDSVFNANKSAILDSYHGLQAAENRLEATTKEAKLDESRIFAAIDQVNQARSALEKANAHMLLMVRQEMDTEQISKMEKFRNKPAE